MSSSNGQFATSRWHGRYFESAFVQTTPQTQPGMQSGNLTKDAVPFQQSMQHSSRMFGIPMPPSSLNVSPMYYASSDDATVNRGTQMPRLTTSLAQTYLDNGGSFFEHK